ncbi:hypothetical protein AMTRI_Chr04g184810 [Amborella trichopoda]
MISILNTTSFHVKFPLLEALAEMFNYQTNTFFLPTSETMPTLEEVARISGLNLVEIAYQPSTATDNHFIMGARLLGAAYSSRGQWFPYSFSPCFLGMSDYTIVPTVLAGIYQGLHDRVTRGDRFIEGSVLILQNVNYYHRILEELSSFDWVIRGLENVSLLLLATGHSCHILEGQHFTEGYFPKRVFRQFRHTQNYTSVGEAIDHRLIFPLHQHSSTLLVKVSLSWKGKKSSSSEGLAKQDRPTITSNYDSWWERACPLPLCLKSSRLRGEFSTPS